MLEYKSRSPKCCQTAEYNNIYMIFLNKLVCLILLHTVPNRSIEFVYRHLFFY